MAEEKKDAAPAKSKKKLFMIIGAALVVALGGGGFMMMKGGKAEAAESHAKEKEEPELGELIRLDPITLNLADGDRYLKVGLSVQLLLAEGGGGGHGAGTDAIEVEILDETIHVLGSMTYEQLTRPHVRENAKK